MTTLYKIALPLFALMLYASGGIVGAAESPRQFDIELLVFQNLVNNDAGEIWPLDYSTWYEEAAEAPPAAGATPLAVTWLPESSFHLLAERNALAGSAGYRPLAYLAWRQPVLDRSQAQPLQIPVSGSRAGAYVDGTVKVAVERYLHLYLDLQLHLPDSAVRSGDSAARVELPEIRLNEQRRMRSKELHYFDNPRFGVIALITPVEQPAEPAHSNATEEPEPAGISTTEEAKPESGEPAPGVTP
jgi:hypothetical protein